MCLYSADHSAVRRLDSLEKNGMEWVKDLGKKNLEDMLQIIQWNEDNVGLSVCVAFLDTEKLRNRASASCACQALYSHLRHT